MKQVRNPGLTDAVLTVATLGPAGATGATSGQRTPVICVAAYRAESLRSRCQQPSDGVQ